MKLSPPASSSDLDAARTLARTLARIARPGEAREAPLPPFAPLPGRQGAAPPARVAEARPAPPAPPPIAAPRPAAAPRPMAPEPRKPAPPAPVVEAPRAAPLPQRPPEPVSPPRPVAKETARPAPPPPPRVEARKPAPFPAEPEAEAEEIGALGDAPLGVTGDDEPIGIVDEMPRRRPEPEIELEVDTGDSAPSLSEAGSNDLVDFDEATDTAAQPESEPDLELVGDFEDEKPAPPSWSDILQDCLFLARAKGALLISPEGAVIAFCGDWPPPGVEAIAVRLVPAMEKALKGAPTRSVSVPLGAQHLTAWRVPLTSGLVTVGFVAEGQLKPEVRPTIDAELKRGAPD